MTIMKTGIGNFRFCLSLALFAVVSLPTHNSNSQSIVTAVDSVHIDVVNYTKENGEIICSLPRATIVHRADGTRELSLHFSDSALVAFGSSINSAIQKMTVDVALDTRFLTTAQQQTIKQLERMIKEPHIGQSR